MLVADHEHCCGAGDDRARCEGLSGVAGETGQTRDQTDKGERPDSRNTGAGAKRAKVEPALNSYQEAAGKRCRKR